MRAMDTPDLLDVLLPPVAKIPGSGHGPAQPSP